MCEQPLDEGAHTHVRALLAYVEGDAQRRARDAQAAVQLATVGLQNLVLHLFEPTSRLFEQVTSLSPATASAISTYIARLKERRDECLSAITQGHADPGPLLDDGGASQSMLDLGQRIESDLVRLAGSDQQATIATLERERQVLRHRQVLTQLFSQIEQWVSDAAWCLKADRSRRALNTRHITDKQGALFDEIVNEDYRNRLQTECESLDCQIPIELRTTPRAGDTRRSFAIAGSRHSPDEILSEGEQRGIALADFLTEVGVSPTTAGIVLDDPVTSQDHQRKEKIAIRLIREAVRRQVIVFTHDLVFANQLFKAAEDADMSYEAHRIDRTADNRPGEVSLRDPVGVSKFYDTTERAKSFLTEARAVTGTMRDDAIRKSMGALRRTIEETVAKRLFKGVVPRWEDRVIVTALPKVNWDSELVENMCVVFEELSRHIEGHTHADDAMGAPPDLPMLEGYIAKVDDMVTRAKRERR